ncbi:peptidoglycan recognition protein family protein [Flavonifractor plautii]|nr:peptidoglycan recognition protein family protein [Flavonifractor plautii]
MRHRPRLIPCLLALVAVLLVIKWIDPFAPGSAPCRRRRTGSRWSCSPQRVLPARHASGGGQRHRHPLRGQPGYHGGAEPQLFHQPGPDGETYASSHFLVGLDGEVLQNVPLNEVAYCSNQRNDDTISIECCHPDDSGEFTSATYESLVRLTRWLMEEYGLDTSQVIRHYDVTGKLCPKAFVEHPEEWERFLRALKE